MLTKLIESGIRFDFDQIDDQGIPYVLDVLYVLRLGEQNKYYDLNMRRSPRYIANTHLAAASIAGVLASMPSGSEFTPRAVRIIAGAIIRLCPDQARCLLVPAYYSAQKIMGIEVPSESADDNVKMRACGCPSCKDMLAEQWRSAPC